MDQPFGAGEAFPFNKRGRTVATAVAILPGRCVANFR
jgi:hypothetical protein